MKSCKQNNCSNPAKVRGYCLNHYQKAMRTGTIQRVRKVPEMHGQSRSAMYYRWLDMRKRCNKPTHADFKDYGARGITVCDRWNESYKAFAADMGEAPTSKHSLDRINNDLGYYPNNCRWATRKEQQNNRRNNVTYTFADMTLTLAEWSELMSVPYATLQQRLNADWPLIRALCEPPSYFFTHPLMHGWCKDDDNV